MFELKYQTPFEWTKAVLADFDAFLQDHAAAEKKASGMAMSMLSHYQDRKRLVKEMTDLALEELIHFKEVLKVFRHGQNEFFLDRLLVGAVIEARGYERFSLVGEALEPGKYKDFYQQIAASEKTHKNLFVDLAYEYFDKVEVNQRLEEILVSEAEICSKLPFRAALH